MARLALLLAGIAIPASLAQSSTFEIGAPAAPVPGAADARQRVAALAEQQADAASNAKPQSGHETAKQGPRATFVVPAAPAPKATAIFSPSRSSRKRNSLNSARSNQKRENNDTADVDELIDDVIVLPKVSDLLNIPKIGLTPMTVGTISYMK